MYDEAWNSPQAKVLRHLTTISGGPLKFSRHNDPFLISIADIGWPLQLQTIIARSMPIYDV
jgi:hypothetical protein